MDTTSSRRDFTKLLGASLVAPLALSGRPETIWARAEREVQEGGLVSAEVTRTLLDNQGTRGIYADPARFEELRAALTRKIHDHKIIREFPLSPDIEPILIFAR